MSVALAEAGIHLSLDTNISFRLVHPANIFPALLTFEKLRVLRSSVSKLEQPSNIEIEFVQVANENDDKSIVFKLLLFLNMKAEFSIFMVLVN